MPGTYSSWEPPRRFAYEEREWRENAPPVATEVIVETRPGGTCVIRMVHSLFTSSEEWDNQLESFEDGWPSYFKILQLYLEHFPGRSFQRGYPRRRELAVSSGADVVL